MFGWIIKAGVAALLLLETTACASGGGSTLLAELGDASAQVTLGVNYGWGRGVPQDYAEAVKWYRKAAAQGNVDGQRLLGYLHLWRIHLNWGTP